MTNVSNVSIWEALKNGDNIYSLIENVPDEFYDWIKVIISDLNESFSAIEKKANSVYEQYKGYERSYIAKKILHEAPKDVKPLAPIVFSMLDGKDYKDTIWKMLRPTYQKPFYQSKDS
jgi:RNA ligase